MRWVMEVFRGKRLRVILHNIYSMTHYGCGIFDIKSKIIFL